MPDEYVIVEKSTLDSIGDTVRSATGSTNSISVNNLNDAVAAAVTSGGVLIDSSLTQSGYAADAKATGDAISSLSEEIDTTSESKVSAHNTGTDTHSDIRLLIQGLTDRLNALADSDDTTLDQLSEVVAYIKSNRSLIEAITTSKVSVADIVDNLTTNMANKPLSAAQGVALKALIDAITVPTTLPNPNALTFTGAVTGRYDGSAPVSVEIPSGGGSSGGSTAEWQLLGTYTMLVSDRSLVIDLSQFEGITHFRIIGNFPKCSEDCGSTYIYLGTAFNHTREPINQQKVYAFSLLAECELVDGQLYGFIGTIDGWNFKAPASVVINTPRDSGKCTSFKIYYANAVNDTTENTIQIWGY